MITLPGELCRKQGRKRVCPRGHDTWKCGRVNNVRSSQCRLCYRILHLLALKRDRENNWDKRQAYKRSYNQFYRDRRNARARDRYWSDPELRERKKAGSKRFHHGNTIPMGGHKPAYWQRQSKESV